MAIRRVAYEQSPVATWLDYDLPRLIMQNAKERRLENRRLKEKKDNIAATGVEAAIKTLDLNSTSEEFAQVEERVSAFKDIYDDDPVMSEWFGPFDDMLGHKSTRAAQNEAIQSSLDASLKDIGTRIKDLDSTKAVKDLVSDTQKSLSENLNMLTKGEASYYDSQLKELDSAATLAYSFIENKMIGPLEPDDPYQAETILANNPEYQGYFDEAHKHFMAGDYTNARTFMNKADVAKVEGAALYDEVASGLEEYFDVEDGVFSDTVKKEWEDEVMPMYTDSGIPVYTNVDLMVASAKSLFEDGDLKGAQAALRKMPSSIGKARAQQVKFLANEFKDKSLTVDEILKTVTSNIKNLEDDVSPKVSTILSELGTSFDTRRGKGQIIGVTDFTKGELEKTIAKLTEYGESYDWTDPTLSIYIDDYADAGAGTDKKKAAEVLSQYILDHQELIAGMDFQTGRGEGELGKARLRNLLEAYDTIDRLYTKQEELENKTKLKRIAEAAR